MIGVVGFSAGGHLAGLAALAPDVDERTSVQFADGTSRSSST
jgi:acetyl esterase/lipase